MRRAYNWASKPAAFIRTVAKFTVLVDCRNVDTARRGQRGWLTRIECTQPVTISFSGNDLYGCIRKWLPMYTGPLAIIARAVMIFAILVSLTEPTRAQTAPSITGYATVGYSELRAANVDTGGVTTRLGWRFGRHFGIEGEITTAVNGDRFIVSPPCPENLLCPRFAPIPKPSLSNAKSIYAVRYFQLAHHADAFVRIGYGEEEYSHAFTSLNSIKVKILNYGLGGYYYLNSNNGIRVDFTCVNMMQRRAALSQAGIDVVGNAWSAAYVVKF